MLAAEGVRTQRGPDAQEQKDIAYGRDVARGIAGFDIGQTVVIAAEACVAVEAMEGTNAAILRAGKILRELEGDASTLERRLTVIKVAKPKQDMRFDVPVIGLATITAMKEAGATCLCVEAGRTLIFDRVNLLREADAASIAILAVACEDLSS
jgi:hypothetical protein